MRKQGICKFQGVIRSYGTVEEFIDKEKDDFIIPDSVRLMFYGERLRPTQFDAHGNPQIGGVAGLMLIWKIRQKVRDGVIKNQYAAEVMYSYDTTDGKPIKIHLDKRLPQPGVCPVCGEQLTVEDLDGVDEYAKLVGDGVKITHNEPRVEKIRYYGYGELAHKDCAREFYRLSMIDEITEKVHLVFNNYTIDDENCFDWGQGGNDMSYELIPNEYCSDNCCLHRPWFLFHLPIGDIKIGWRKRVINITFMPNFKQFDMAILSEENVTKHFSGDGSRTIHADSVEKMFEYLTKVRKYVLPNKEK